MCHVRLWAIRPHPRRVVESADGAVLARNALIRAAEAALPMAGMPASAGSKPVSWRNPPAAPGAAAGANVSKLS